MIPRSLKRILSAGLTTTPFKDAGDAYAEKVRPYRLWTVGVNMRCYNGVIHDGDYIRRYGYSQYAYRDLRKANPHILITWFPVEEMYSACVPDEGYRNLGDFCRDKMDCLLGAIEIYEKG